MSAPDLAAIPPTLKSSILKYLRIAADHDKRDPVISYYCRLYAMQYGMTVDKKSPDARQFLVQLMDFLETSKANLKDDEAIHNEVCGQAHVENYALKLFLHADNQDRNGNFGKNVVKTFLTSGLLLDVLSTFGEINEDLDKNRKYAKWKATYITKCVQMGETPIAGPLPEEGENEYAPSGAAPPYPPSTMTDSGVFPAPGAHAPPTTPQDPRAGGYQDTSYPPYPPPQQPAGSGLSPYPANPANPSQQYQPQQPGPSSVPSVAATDWTPPPNPAGVKITSEQFQKGIKYCKYASSAMQYEDTQTAIDNLTKALKLLTTGVDQK